MKELKILVVVVAFTLATYWGVEPFAHGKMHPHIDAADFKFSDLKDSGKKGDAKTGANTFMSAGCIGCHSLSSQGMKAPMDNATFSASFGVVPPDLSNSGAIYDEKFLAALIKNPTKTLKVEHKFVDGKMHPMVPFYGLGGDIDQEVADIVAYLKSIAPKKELSDKEVFIDACGRCHSVKYDGWARNSEDKALDKYMGTNPPDLSIMIRAKSKEYLTNFIDDPQKLLEGTAMPRVGLKEDKVKQVISYLESVGDRKKDERESTTKNILIFLVAFTFFAFLWKKSMWKDLH
jgi:ubiquinol-cytochrome c reductase cytochrome c1 subunit